MAEIQSSGFEQTVGERKSEMSRVNRHELNHCQQVMDGEKNYNCIQEGPIVTAHNSSPNPMQDGNDLLRHVCSLIAVSDSRLEKCNVASVNYGGMGNTTYNYNSYFYMQDVSDIMNHIHEKDSWPKNNVAKAGDFEGTNASCEDMTDRADLDQSADQEHSLTVMTPFPNEPAKKWISKQFALDKTKTCSATLTKGIPENEDVCLKSTVKLCQTSLKNTPLPNVDVDPPSIKPKLKYGTCHPQSESMTNPSTSICNPRPRGYSVDLHAKQSGLLEEPSSSMINQEIRLAKIEKASKQHRDFILSLKEQIADLDNVSDIRVRTVTKTSIEKIIKIAELHPEMMKDISTYLDDKLMSDYDNDTPRCCSVM